MPPPVRGVTTTAGDGTPRGSGRIARDGSAAGLVSAGGSDEGATPVRAGGCDNGATPVSGGGSDSGDAARTRAAASGTPTKSTAARSRPGQRAFLDGGAGGVEPPMTRLAHLGQIPSVNCRRNPRHEATPIRRG